MDREQGGPGGAAAGADVKSRLALVGLAAVFIALSLYATLTSETGRYVPDARLEQVLAPEQNLERQAYLWDDSRTLGTTTSSYFFTPVPSAFQAAIGALGVAPWVIERLTHALYLALAALGVILLLREFRPRIGLEHALAAFVYAFCPFSSQFLIPSQSFLSYALAPWFVWIVLRGIRGNDPWRWAAAFALAVALPGAANGASSALALVPAALTVVYLLTVERLGLGRIWGWTWRAGLLSVLTCAATLVVLAYAGSELGPSLRTTETPEVVAGTSAWSESWRGLGFWVNYYVESTGELVRSQAMPYFTQLLVIAATFLAPLGALIGLALVGWRDRLLFAAMLLVSLVLMVGIHKTEGLSPFGHLLTFAFDHSDLALGFRTTYKAGPGLMLGIAVLLGVGVVAAMEAGTRGGPGRRSGPGSSWLRPVGLGVVLPVFVAVGVLVASFPFWTERLYPDVNGFKDVPRYWEQTFSYLKERQQPSRVLVLPGAEEARHRWGRVHDSLFDALSPTTPLMTRALRQGTPESADLVTAIDEYASSHGYEQGSLAPILARLGVRWVVLQNDLDWQHMAVPRPDTYEALRADPSLRLAATFGPRGANTASPDDPSAEVLGERALPPVEIYEVAGAPPPRPRLLAGPPLLVAGGGDSWPALASAGLLDGPPVGYTGAAGDEDLRELILSGAQVVVTDGNRRRAIAVGTGRPSLSPTLAPDDPSVEPPYELFAGSETQSVVTYPDAAWITASRYGFQLSSREAAARPGNAFDGVERTAWTLKGPLDPDGESVTVRLRRPTTVSSVSVLPAATDPWRVKAVDVIARSEDGEESEQRLRFQGGVPNPARARIDATEVTEIELRIAEVEGPGPVGLSGIALAEIGVTTPDGPLDLREFVRAPDDLAARAARDAELAVELAARPPRYELRRVTGVAGTDEETELRREITTFGEHSYRLSATARIDNRSADSASDALLGEEAGAVGTSHLGGRGGLVADGDLETGWGPEPRIGERLDLRFPTTEVRNVEVLAVSGPPHGVARSRVTEVQVSAGADATASARSVLPRARRCVRNGSPARGCLERHVVQLPPTDTDHLSVTLTGIDPVIGRFRAESPNVVEVRVNGRDLSELADPEADAQGGCAPLFAIDGRPVQIRLPRDQTDLLLGRPFGLRSCGRIRLGPGRHRIETLAGLSGSVRMVSLVPLEWKPARAAPQVGRVRLLDRSPTQLDLLVEGRGESGLLVGGMPSHQGWVAEGEGLSRQPVPLDTFAAWGVEADAAGPVTLSFDPQRVYRLAMALSIASAAWCLWRVTRRRRGTG